MKMKVSTIICVADLRKATRLYSVEMFVSKSIVGSYLHLNTQCDDKMAVVLYTMVKTAWQKHLLN